MASAFPNSLPTADEDLLRAGFERSLRRSTSTVTAAPSAWSVSTRNPKREFSSAPPILNPWPRPTTVYPQATDEALAYLSGEDRMILSAYYLDGRTLAEIARILGVHESTISRKLDKLAKSLRKQIVGGLARRGMSRRQAEEALEIDVRDLQVDIRRSLAQESPPSTFSEKRVEARVREGEG